jgi:3-phosphoshikimate 1-carboxyvinyltransferase
MALPELIEIVPLDKPVRAEITVPGSKSITNRALILAALADGETVLRGVLWSEDTEVMIDALQKLGFKIKIQQDPNESLNRIVTVKGLGGKIPKAGTEKKPLEIHVHNAGTAARFLTAFLCLGKGVYRLHGVPRMHERPQAALLDVLRKPKLHERLLGALFPNLQKLGYRVDSSNGKLPIVIYGEGPKSGKCRVSIKESSQFASALLLCAETGGWDVEVIDYNPEESPYVAMTLNLIKAFPKRGGVFRIEPDASSGSYFWGKGWLFPMPLTDILENKSTALSDFEAGAKLFPEETASEQPLNQQMTFSVKVSRWPKSEWQIDEKFPGFLWQPQTFPKEVSRTTDLGDSIMTAIVLAPFASESCKFTDLGRLRVQECERVVALRTELTKCGAKVVEEGDTLTVWPSPLHGAEIETYNDHRMAMCFAILGLKVPGIKIKNPACVKKTFPNFFQKLAAQPPHGLGATILDAKSGRKLTHEELFAE